MHCELVFPKTKPSGLLICLLCRDEALRYTFVEPCVVACSEISDNCCERDGLLNTSGYTILQDFEGDMLHERMH